eukprot:2616395-Prymnesium_polylepis.2
MLTLVAAASVAFRPPPRGVVCNPPKASAPTTMLVDAVESTPNPCSFLLRLDAPLEGLASVTGLRGQTFGQGSRGCPMLLARALGVKGVDSLFVFAQAESVTVNKKSSAAWES